MLASCPLNVALEIIIRYYNSCVVVIQEEDASLVPASADSGFQFQAAGALQPHDNFRF